MSEGFSTHTFSSGAGEEYSGGERGREIRPMFPEYFHGVGHRIDGGFGGGGFYRRCGGGQDGSR
ncbi:hypothetical protein GCM10023212_03590 [Luteolibacter yonseiensis]